MKYKASCKDRRENEEIEGMDIVHVLRERAREREREKEREGGG